MSAHPWFGGTYIRRYSYTEAWRNVEFAEIERRILGHYQREVIELIDAAVAGINAADEDDLAPMDPTALDYATLYGGL